MKRELFISVDVEAAGPIPGEFSLLSIGACHVDEPERTFVCELKPINMNADPKALEVSGFSLEALAQTGLDPAEAMADFESWLSSGLGRDDALVFVGLNAAFDWSFVNYYFYCFLGRNPFGFTALDIKAYYMGVTGCRWSDATSGQWQRPLDLLVAAITTPCTTLSIRRSCFGSSVLKLRGLELAASWQSRRA